MLKPLIFCSLIPASLFAISYEDVLTRTEDQFRSSFYYSASLLAAIEGHDDESTELLRRASESDPASPLLKRELSEAYGSLGRDAEAVAAMEAALSRAPLDRDLRHQLARLYVRGKEGAKARALYGNPAHGVPEAERLHALAAMDLAEEKWLSAVDLLQKLVQGNPDRLDDHELLAAALDKAGQGEAAEAALKAVLKKDAQRPHTWLRLASLYEDREKDKAVIETLDLALKANPGDIVLTDSRARANYRQERFAQAAKDFDRLLETDKEDRQSLLYRGMTRLQLREFKDAQADFTALGLLEKDNPSQLYGLGLSQMWQDQEADAEKTFLALLELQPGMVHAYVQLAFLYDKHGRTGEAVALLARGVEKAPESDELPMLLGAAYLDLKDYASAEKAYLAAIARPGKPAASLRFQLAVLYDKWQKFDQTEKVLTALIEDEPKNAQALNYLGYSWVDKGVQLDQAQAMIERALKEEPDNHYFLDSLGWSNFKQGRFEAARRSLDKAATKVGTEANSEEAVVFDHLAATLHALKRSREAAVAEKRAALIRQRAEARTKAPKAAP